MTVKGGAPSVAGCRVYHVIRVAQAVVLYRIDHMWSILPLMVDLQKMTEGEALCMWVSAAHIYCAPLQCSSSGSRSWSSSSLLLPLNGSSSCSGGSSGSRSSMRLEPEVNGQP